MKSKKPLLKRLSLVASVLLNCAPNLPAQTAPTITTQPANQTVLPGTNASFSVAVAGTGPFSYQWQFNGTNSPNNIITTVAGNGTSTNAGDGGAAINASLYHPWDVAFDLSGNLFIADRLNYRIRKVDANGIISTVAGNGIGAYAGDGGAATNASLNNPDALAFDSAGNLYIGDDYNGRVRKLDANGIITTVAGTNTEGFSGDGGAAVNAQLYGPCGVGFDAAGNLFIADNSNERVRKVGTNGIITTVAGKGGLPNYSGDGGPATNATFAFPVSVSFDAAGNLYIADDNNCLIRKVSTNGIIKWVAGYGVAWNGLPCYGGDGGPATNAYIANPVRTAMDASGNLYIADAGNGRIRMVDANGIITTVAGHGQYGTPRSYSGDGGVATNASLNYPTGLAFDAAGNLYIADSGNNRIRKVHFAGDPTFTLANVSTSNAGSYSVVITSPYGGVTSAVATLTVNIPTTPPQIMASGGYFGFLTNQFGFDLSGAFGQTIVVDSSSDLVKWTPLFTNTVSGNPFYFCDLYWTNFPARFYRARLQ